MDRARTHAGIRKQLSEKGEMTGSCNGPGFPGMISSRLGSVPQAKIAVRLQE